MLFKIYSELNTELLYSPGACRRKSIKNHRIHILGFEVLENLSMFIVRSAVILDTRDTEIFLSYFNFIRHSIKT